MARARSPVAEYRAARARADSATVTGRAVEALRTAILEGRRPPGERLIEAELCAWLGVSRASLREALRILAAERLITLVPHRGPAVAEITWEQAEEIYGVRAMLEGEAAAHAAARIEAAGLARMRRALRAFERAVADGDARGRLAATAGFYDAMLEGSGDRIVPELLAGLVARINWLRARSMRGAGRARVSALELRRLLRAIEARDPEAARAAAVAHVRAACAAARAAYLDEDERPGDAGLPPASLAGTARAWVGRESAASPPRSSTPEGALAMNSPVEGPTAAVGSRRHGRRSRPPAAGRSALAAGLVAALAAGLAPRLEAQEWPQRPLRILVPFAAGGNTDGIARITAEWLTTRMGQPVLVDNRPGASGSIATEAVARSQPDGYTLLIGTPTQLAIFPAMARTPYDPSRDFAPMSIIGTNPYALAVHPSMPVKNLKELVALARQRPGQIPYGSAGNGAGTHLVMAMFLARSGVQMNHIPYKGGAVATAELLGGQVAAYFGNIGEIVPHAKTGRVRALAVSSLRRSSQLPEVPTVTEQGYPGFDAFTWNGLLGPAKTPPAVVNRIAAEVAAAVRDPAVARRLEAITVDPLGNTPAEFAKVLAESIRVYADAVKVSGAKAE